MKILSFDRNLKDRVGNEITIGILYQSEYRISLNTKEQIIKEFQDLAIKKIQDLPLIIESINIKEERDLSEIGTKYHPDILYLTPLRALDIKEIYLISRDNRILTISSVPDYVEKGIAVGIGSKGSKPEILINLPAAQAEGANFSSQLLKLATVFN